MAFRIMVSGSIFIDLKDYNSPHSAWANRLGWYMAVPVEYKAPRAGGQPFVLVRALGH